MKKTNNGRRYDDQKEPDDRINLSREQLQHLVEMSPEPIIIYCDQRIVYVNPAGITMVGAEHKAEVIGKDITDLLQPDQVNNIADEVQTFLETNKPSDLFERQIIRFDGITITVEVRAIPLMYGGMPAIQFLCRNITEQRQVEQTLKKEQLLLRESTETYERLIEFLPEPIIVMENDLILYMNVSAEKLARCEYHKQLVGKNVYECIHPRDHDRVREIFSKTLHNNERSSFAELKVKCCEGDYIDVEMSSIRIHNYMGKTVVISVLRDLTESKRSQEMLIKSEKLSVIGQLAAGVAHEIRNPLTVLKGFTQLLSKDLGNKHLYISTMLSELDRINDIVNEFMTLSKPQFVQFHSNYIYNILNSVISILETQAILVNVNIKISYANQIPLILCDENQLKQVFINIIKNSIEAMPFGGEIDILVELIERKKLLIRICDQGPGIPQEIIRRIGEPFYTTKENGTGLGIMVCQRIIDAHNGTLHISSEPGLGATIDILLPVE